MSSLIFQRYTGLPNADDGEVEEILTAKACSVRMSGSDGFEFTAPVSLLSRLSAPIDALVQSVVEGAHTCLNLEVPDKDIFYRFFQFVYTGKCDDFAALENACLADNTKTKTPFCTKKSAERADEVETQPVLPGFGASTTSIAEGLFGPNPPVSSAGRFFGRSTQPVPSGGALFGCPQPGGQSQHEFELPYSIVSCRDAMRRATPPLIPNIPKCKEVSVNNVNLHLSFKSHAISAFLQSHYHMYSWQTATASKRDYGNVLVGHAKLWQFADKYAIASLMEFSSLGLTRELACWMINASAFITDFGKLVRHSYDGCSAGGNTLQRLTAKFAACVLEDVKDLEGWQELLGEVPAFRSDLGHALVEVYSTWQTDFFG